MKEYETKEYKDEAVKRLRAIDVERYQLSTIDQRLEDYVMEVRRDAELHNLYEVLAVVKFFRLMDMYVFRASKVRRFTKFYECLKFSGLDGRRCYRLTKVQYFQFASILGFYKWVDVGAAEGWADSDSVKAKAAEAVMSKREKREQERRMKGSKTRKGNRKASAEEEKKKRTWKIESGRRYELRRLVREAVLFVPRKFSKTTSTASMAVNELIFGDANAQAYTAANSYGQAKICFDEISKILKQLDKKKKYFRFTRETVKWREGNKFGNESTVDCLTGGGGTKDGLNASLIIFDEYAQAKYVKDRSEGAELLQVLKSSTGTRKEYLTVIITTASRVPDGPFAVELEESKKVLREEYRADYLFSHLFMPDAWEVESEDIGRPEVWQKCNPHIGITVQNAYYQDSWEEAQHNSEKLIEFKTKLLNIFVSGGLNAWVPGSLIRANQIDWHIEKTEGRPRAMVGIDLSVSDDFSIVVYNIYSKAMKMFYVWLDCYIPEQTLLNHSNRDLYQLWVDNGWMKVCPGQIIDVKMITNDIIKRNESVAVMQIGYDSYKSQEFVNNMSAAIQSNGGKPENVLKAVPQTYGAFTSPVETFEMAVKHDPSRVSFCESPILPYCFDNCYLDEDRMRNKKPIKRMANLKIDAAIGVLETFWLYNNWEE